MANNILPPQPNPGEGVEIIVKVIKKVCEVVCDTKNNNNKKG